jgi:hypothetical protein
MSSFDRQRYEKQEEKEEEKVQEKQDEKQGEKSWDEKWRRDPVNAAAWAIALIWAGLVLLAENLNLLANYGDPEPWWVILAGAGIIFVIEAVVRLLVPSYRRNVVGTFVLGVILLGIGLGNLFGANITWAAVLIAIGVAMLLRGLLGGR